MVRLGSFFVAASNSRICNLATNKQTNGKMHDCVAEFVQWLWFHVLIFRRTHFIQCLFKYSNECGVPVYVKHTHFPKINRESAIKRQCILFHITFWIQAPN